jgi:hypothetical protein
LEASARLTIRKHLHVRPLKEEHFSGPRQRAELMDENLMADHVQGRDVLGRLCELTVDLSAVGFRWTCMFTADEAAAIIGWLALAGRCAAGVRAVAEQVSAAFRALATGTDVLVVDRYVETAVYLLDEVTDSYPEHAAQVEPIAELLFTRLYAGN